MGFPSCDLVRTMVAGRTYRLTSDLGRPTDRKWLKGVFREVDAIGYVRMTTGGRTRSTLHWSEVTGVLTPAEAREYQLA